MLEIIPGILEKEWSEIERKIELVLPFAKTIHIDIIDGKFANNLTFLNPEPFQKYTNKVDFELHMMVEEPINYIDSWANAGFKRFLGHVEHMSDQAEFVRRAKLLGEVGLALDGPTEISALKVSLETIDTVLVYTSNHVGFSGPELLPERLEKIKLLKQAGIPIEVDGGINDKTITLAKNAGANRFVTTSYLFSEGNPEEKYNRLSSLLVNGGAPGE